jgi:hypothetical protein
MKTTMTMKTAGCGVVLLLCLLTATCLSGCALLDSPEQKYLEVQGAYIAATTVLLELKQQELIEQDRWDEYVQPLIEEGDSLLDDMKVQLDAGNLDRLELLRRSLLRLVVLLQVVEMTG